MRSRTWLITVALCVGCGGGADKPAEKEASDGEPVKVTCKAVTSRDVDDTVQVTGVIAPPPKLDAVISSPIAGRVASVAVEEGDQVAAGALLASVEDPALPAGSLEARAGVASAKAAQQAADQDVARQQRLVDSGIGARRDLDDAKAKAAAASAEVDAATARDGLASQRLARRELRAPHAGVVLHVYRRAGESVDGTAATPIAEVADTSVLELRGQVPPAMLVKLTEGARAQVTALGIDGALTGTVVRVSPAVDATTMLGTVRVKIAPAPRLPVGSSATATIVIAHRKGIVVPATALRRSAVGSDELIACEDGAAKVHVVTVGTRGDKDVEIASGIDASAKIVVDHVLGIEDGRKLEASP